MKGIGNDVLEKKIDAVMDRLMNLGGGDYSKDKNGDHDVQFTGLVERDFGIAAPRVIYLMTIEE